MVGSVTGNLQVDRCSQPSRTLKVEFTRGWQILELSMHVMSSFAGHMTSSHSLYQRTSDCIHILAGPRSLNRSRQPATGCSRHSDAASAHGVGCSGAAACLLLEWVLSLKSCLCGWLCLSANCAPVRCSWPQRHRPKESLSSSLGKDGAER